MICTSRGEIYIGKEYQYKTYWKCIVLHGSPDRSGGEKFVSAFFLSNVHVK